MTVTRPLRWVGAKENMKFHSFEEFKQVRMKAAQWRTVEKQLDALGDVEREVVREVLLVEVIDNRTDRGYEKRLYDGYKRAIERLMQGRPLVEENKNQDLTEQKMLKRQRQFEEGARFMGLSKSPEWVPPPPVSTYFSPYMQPSSDSSPPSSPPSPRWYKVSSPSPQRPSSPLTPSYSPPAR